MCKVSVVLPVYNVGAHVKSTIESLLQQTYQDFELLIIDDCSTDNTVEQIRTFTDPRLQLILNTYNLGRAGTDNAALKHVRGKYIAKMDGDDLCRPERLAMQVAFLEANKDVNVVGAWVQNFGASKYLNRYPATPAAAKARTLFTMPIGNPTVMLRTNLFLQQGLRYDDSLRQTEDYDFFARYVHHLRIATLPKVLLDYRVPHSTIKTAILTERSNVADEVRTQFLTKWGIPYNARELQVHNTISMIERPLGDIRLTEVEAWLQRLLHFNNKQQLFDSIALQQEVGERWFEICYAHPQAKLGSIRHFSRSPLAAYFPLLTMQQLKFWTKALRKF